MKEGNRNMKKVIIASISLLTGATLAGSLMKKPIKYNEQKAFKFKAYYNMLNQWLSFKQNGKGLESYFIKKGYEEIAIYGMGEVGNRLYDELKATRIKVQYVIDKNAENTYSELDVYNLEDDLPNVDAIIVSPVFAFNEIKEQLSKKVDFPIINLEDVVYCV